MCELPIISDLRKKYDGYMSRKRSHEKLDETKILQDWKDRVVAKYLKKRGGNLNTSPYTDYVLTYCQYCNNFKSNGCFTENGGIYSDDILKCSQFKLQVKLLEKEELEYHHDDGLD